MKLLEQDSVIAVFESESGNNRIIASKCTTATGNYWSVDHVTVKNGKPIKAEKIATRCTWEQVTKFTEEFNR